MEYNRVKWASRLGMLELDLLLGPFVDHRYLALSERDQVRFQRLLDEQDQDLYQYLMGYSVPADAELAMAAQMVRDFALNPPAL